jgi:hypothetical protein
MNSSHLIQKEEEEPPLCAFRGYEPIDVVPRGTYHCLAVLPNFIHVLM